MPPELRCRLIQLLRVRAAAQHTVQIQQALPAQPSRQSVAWQAQHITQPAYTHTVQTIQPGLFPVECRDGQGGQDCSQLMLCFDHLFAATTRQAESCQGCWCTGKPGFIAQCCKSCAQVFQQCGLTTEQGETALHFE